MTRPRIDQLLAGFADGDAISNAALILRDTLRSLGHASDLFADPDRVSPTLRDACGALDDYAPGSDDITLYHYGIASPATDTFLKIPGSRILVYHNITPAEYFNGYDDAVAHQLNVARKELKTIAGQADAVWSVSRFNATELEAMGLTDVRVLELPFGPAPLAPEGDPEVRNRLQAPLTTLLFVGRMAPNKRLEDLFQAFAWYNKTINPQSRLLVVGSDRSCPRYSAMLRMLIGDLVTPNICLEGFASPAGLCAYYELSDLYISTSEHEGYCLPLLEAMYKGLPVISRNAGGVPEAMGNAGVRYEQASPRELAELIHLVLSDRRLRTEVMDGQRKRMEQVRSRNLGEEITSLLEPIINTPKGES